MTQLTFDYQLNLLLQADDLRHLRIMCSGNIAVLPEAPCEPHLLSADAVAKLVATFQTKDPVERIAVDDTTLALDFASGLRVEVHDCGYESWTVHGKDYAVGCDGSQVIWGLPTGSDWTTWFA